jgi:hypothetical protein
MIMEGKMRNFISLGAFMILVFIGSSISTATPYYSTDGSYTSPIYRLVNQDYGPIDWTAQNQTSVTTVSIKVRSSTSSTMSGATVWASCPIINSGDDLSAVSSVTDGEIYFQYQVLFETSDQNTTPTLDSITVSYNKVTIYNNIGVAVNLRTQITDSSSISSVEAYVQYPDGTTIATVNLLDDGIVDDGVAANNIYGYNWNSSGQSAGMFFVDIKTEDELANTTTANNVGRFFIDDCDTSDTNISVATDGTCDKDGDGYVDKNAYVGAGDATCDHDDDHSGSWSITACSNCPFGYYSYSDYYSSTYYCKYPDGSNYTSYDCDVNYFTFPAASNKCK